MTTAEGIARHWLSFLQERLEIPGFILQVSRPDEEWSVCSRFSDLEKKTPMTEHSPFPIASLTKMFTAVAILRLCEEKKLELRTPVSEILTDFQVKSADRRSTTVEHLLSHTAGLPREGGGKNYWNTFDLPSQEEILTFIRTVPNFYPPGQRYKYSNLGSALLGTIVERVSGVSYDHFIENFILKPLELTRTTLRLPDEVSDFVPGYAPWEKGSSRKRFEAIDCRGLGGASKIISTANDVMRFANLWIDPEFGSEVLSWETRQEMLRPRWIDGSQKSGRTLMANWIEREGVNIYAVYGWLPGYRCYLSLVPEQKIRVFSFCNVHDYSPTRIGEQVLDLLLRYSSDEGTDPGLSSLIGSYENLWGRIQVGWCGESKLVVSGIGIDGPSLEGYIVPSKESGFRYEGQSGSGSYGESVTPEIVDGKPGIFIGDHFHARYLP